MSTKNLARTVIEGGRTGAYKATRDLVNRTERHQVKEHLNQCARDPEVYDEGDDPETQTPIDRFHPFDEKFADKLNPAERWLEKRVGKSWDKTYSQLREKFDDRTTAGRHILFDHLLQNVSEANDDSRWYNDLVIDKNGVLRERKVKPRGRWVDGYPKVEDWQTSCNFLSGRKVGQHLNGDLYWFEPVRPGVFSMVYGYGPVIHNLSYRDGKVVYAYKDPYGGLVKYEGGFRQAKKLTDKERGRFMTLNRKVREEILSRSPISNKEDKAA
jgi:hypothetical protein